jgi:hypothetical protein
MDCPIVIYFKKMYGELLQSAKASRKRRQADCPVMDFHFTSGMKLDTNGAFHIARSVPSKRTTLDG